LQAVGQFPSQASGASTTPFPHSAEHSPSFVASHPSGQQPSPLVHAVTGSVAHCASQVATAPVIESVVQGSPSSQVVGQSPSQISPASRRPFPHDGSQSLSFVEVHDPTQHASSLVHPIEGASQWS
jgi:hypothetical protein